MSETRKRGLLEMSIYTVKILMFILLGFNAFVFIYFGVINRGNVIESEPVRAVKEWTLNYGEDGDQTLRSVLPKDVMDNEYIFLETRNDVFVYINGELRKDFVEDRDVNIPGGSFRRFLMSVPLSEADSGAEVMIVRISPQEIDKEIPEVYVGTRSGITSYLMKTIGVSFVLAFIVLIFSFAAFVVSIVLRFWYKKVDMMYGALGIFFIAAWVITDSYLFPFVFGVYHVNGLLNYMFSLLMPLPLVIYLSSLQHGRYKKIVSVVMLLSLLNAVVWPVLHFTGLVPFDDVRTIANVVLVVLALAGLILLIVDGIRGKAASYRSTFIGFLGFLVGCLVELSLIFLSTDGNESIPMVFGLGFFLTFIVVQQVHDLRKINMERQRAIDTSEAKTRFLASMSHEIRTPINAILGMNEMILRENDDRTIDEYARNIKTSGKMLLMLVNDVLDFTKIEAGKLEIREEPFLMSDLLYDVTSLIKERAEEKHLELETEITGEIPKELVGDEFRIRQILINLMSNAVKYTEKGTVTLQVGGSCSEDICHLELCVKDTGKGIPKEDQEHLFEAFQRADVKANANIEGAGLGLAIVKSIVDSMNGEVGVLSEYGTGSEFRVKLPVKYTSKEPLETDFMERRAGQPENAGVSGFSAPDAKILAVDDNQSNLTIVKLFLKRNGIVPDLCSSGERAASLCREKKYDLILLDHMMPEPDGIETLHIIRNDVASLNRDTKAVVLTANAVAGSRKMYLDEGFDDYLTKPLDSTVLEETVKRMLPKEKVTLSSSQSADDGKTPDSDRFSALEGFDYETALTYCGDEEEFLLEIMGDIARECPERADRMRKSLEAKDMRAYAVDAHSIKSSMATIGLKDFSERAKKHEFAAKDNDTAYVYGDAESFISDYTALCENIAKIADIKGE